MDAEVRLRTNDPSISQATTFGRALHDQRVLVRRSVCLRPAGCSTDRIIFLTKMLKSSNAVRDAGALVLGVTNVPEGGMWLETYNHVYGRTLNPWNLEHTAGGSSGGDGAIVAAGGAPFAIASDIGGSIRLPAAFCGSRGSQTHRLFGARQWPLSGSTQLTGSMFSPVDPSPVTCGGLATGHASHR